MKRKSLLKYVCSGALAVVAVIAIIGLVGCGSEPKEEVNTFDLTVGTKVDLDNGLSVSVDSIDTSLVNYDGSSITAVAVTYTNNGEESASYNMYDWKGQDANGAAETSTIFVDGPEPLNSGDLAAGGTVSGSLFFEAGTVKALYYGNVFDEDPTASWVLE